MNKNKSFKPCLCVVVLIVTLAITVTLSAQTSIRYGDNLLGTINCGETDTYNFQGHEGDYVGVHVVELNDFGGVCSGLACFCFDQYVELLDSNNNVLAVNTSPNGNNTQNRFRTILGPEKLQTDGIYKITIRDKQTNGRGDYAIFLQCINNPIRTDSLTAGVSELANLNPGEVDTYIFHSFPLDSTIIDMTPDIIGNVIPRMALYNENGQIIALPDSGHISGAFKTGGNFTLLAFSDKDESGTYRLNYNVTLLHNSAPIAVDDSAITQQNRQVAINVLANDSDPDGNPLKIVSVTQGMNGRVIHNGVYIIYTTDNEFIGTDEFYYSITDQRDTNTATVTVVVTSATDVEKTSKTTNEIMLTGNFPNPFNSGTKIRFFLPKAMNVRLSVYNILGQKVVTLINGYRMNGVNEINFNANKLSSGLYFCLLETEGFVDKKLMLLLK